MLARSVTYTLMTCAAAMLAISCTSNGGGQQSQPAKPGTKAALAKANPQMTAVLDELKSMNPKPIPQLSPAQARKQPSPTDAVMQLMKERGMDASPQPVGNVDNRTIPGPGGAGTIPVRVYTPKGEGPFPVLVYFHGGGWVIATLDTYDPSCRALTNSANCVVVSVDYRQAPEHKFPAAHEDSYAAAQWVMNNAGQIGGDPARVAVGGESAGGNLAAAVCLMAKDRGGRMPVHQLLVYPIADHAFDTESYRANAEAKPLDRKMMQWFFGHYLSSPRDGQNKYVSLVRAPEQLLRDVPPATVITAEIDPLRSEGRAYADKLKAAGVDVAYRDFEGVTHEFFGMATVVDEAKQAQQFAARRLRQAFGGSGGNRGATSAR